MARPGGARKRAGVGYSERVLHADVELRDLDARQWTNWWRLVVPPRVQALPRWALIVVDERAAPLKVIVGGEAVAIPRDAPPIARLDRWAERLDAAAVIAVERGAIAGLAGEVEAALRMDMDYVEQGLVVLRALKARAGSSIWTEPPLLDVFPAPTYDALQRTFDLLIPDDSALVAYIVDDDRARIHASIIARKAGGDVTRVATHRAIADLVPEATFARDWEKQAKRVVQAVEERFGKPALAVFLERATVDRILTGPSDQLARELNAKRVVIDPAPAWLLGLLGGAAVAAMAGRAASALAAMLPQAARDRASAFKKAAGTALKESGPWAHLGFDPLELWARLRAFYAPSR